MHGLAVLGIVLVIPQCPNSNNTPVNHQANPQKQENMKTRNGKIARLPLEIRDQLNTRLADGELGNRLVEWLNANPAVMKVMAEQFDGRPINESNLSEWRSGGYEEWLTLHSFLDDARILSENSGCVAETGITSHHLHMVLLAHHAHLLQNWEIMPDGDFHKKLDGLRKLTASIMNMRRAEQNAARLQIQRERLELLREKQGLKSASSSKTASSTSGNARPNAAETPNASTPSVSPSGPGISSNSDSSSAEGALPPLSAPRPKSAPIPPPLSTRIQPEFQDGHLVTHLPSHPLFPAPRSLQDRFDSPGSTLTHPPKLAA